MTTSLRPTGPIEQRRTVPRCPNCGNTLPTTPTVYCAGCELRIELHGGRGAWRLLPTGLGPSGLRPDHKRFRDRDR